MVITALSLCNPYDPSFPRLWQIYFESCLICCMVVNPAWELERQLVMCAPVSSQAFQQHWLKDSVVLMVPLLCVSTGLRPISELCLETDASLVDEQHSSCLFINNWMLQKRSLLWALCLADRSSEFTCGSEDVEKEQFESVWKKKCCSELVFVDHLH